MMNGVELNARYALMPNRLGFCGDKKLEKILTGYLERKEDVSVLENELRKLHTSFSYLSLIARANKKDVFDYDVVEAYWIGNEFLENVKITDFQQFFYENLVVNKLSKKNAEKLAGKLPSDMLPHHSFHALVDRFVLERTDPVLITMNNCRIGWAQIKIIGNETRGTESYRNETMGTESLKLNFNYRKPKFELIRCEENVFHKLGEFKSIEEPRIGDWVSTHWWLAVQKLNQKQVKNLKKYTNQNLKALNKFLPNCRAI